MKVDKTDRERKIEAKLCKEMGTFEYSVQKKGATRNSYAVRFPQGLMKSCILYRPARFLKEKNAWYKEGVKMDDGRRMERNLRYSETHRRDNARITYIFMIIKLNKGEI
jgi:hypothetical protein